MKQNVLLLIVLFAGTKSIAQVGMSPAEPKIKVGIADYIGKEKVSLAALEKSDGLTVEVDDKRENLEIIGFTILIKGKTSYVESIKGGKFSDALKAQFKTLKPGAKLQFKDVKVKGLDGREKVKSFVYTVGK